MSFIKDIAVVEGESGIQDLGSTPSASTQIDAGSKAVDSDKYGVYRPGLSRWFLPCLHLSRWGRNGFDWILAAAGSNKPVGALILQQLTAKNIVQSAKAWLKQIQATPEFAFAA